MWVRSKKDHLRHVQGANATEENISLVDPFAAVRGQTNVHLHAALGPGNRCVSARKRALIASTLRPAPHCGSRRCVMHWRPVRMPPATRTRHWPRGHPILRRTAERSSRPSASNDWQRKQSVPHRVVPGSPTYTARARRLLSMMSESCCRRLWANLGPNLDAAACSTKNAKRGAPHFTRSNPYTVERQVAHPRRGGRNTAGPTEHG